MNNPIKKTSELISFLQADRSLVLYWQSGSRPSAPGSYSIGDVRVYASAVNGAEKIEALKCIRNEWNFKVFALKIKFRIANS